MNLNEYHRHCVGASLTGYQSSTVGTIIDLHLPGNLLRCTQKWQFSQSEELPSEFSKSVDCQPLSGTLL